jgi:hypothetical protein
MSRENQERRERERTAPRVDMTQPDYSPFSDGRSYEEVNWARLSPARRDAHNRWRQARGLPAIPPPAVDLYVAPQETPPVRVPSAEDIKEARAAAQSFLRPPGMMLPGAEGFYINGVKQKL